MLWNRNWSICKSRNRQVKWYQIKTQLVVKQENLLPSAITTAIWIEVSKSWALLLKRMKIKFKKEMTGPFPDSLLTQFNQISLGYIRSRPKLISKCKTNRVFCIMKRRWESTKRSLMILRCLWTKESPTHLLPTHRKRIHIWSRICRRLLPDTKTSNRSSKAQAKSIRSRVRLPRSTTLTRSWRTFPGNIRSYRWSMKNFRSTQCPTHKRPISTTP